MNIRKTTTRLMLFSVLLFMGKSNAFAQQTPVKDNSDKDQSSTQTAPTSTPPENNFMIVGLTTFGFVNQSTTNTLGGIKSTDKSNSIGDVDRYEFSPMFLWRHGDKLLAEFEPSWNGSSIGVNWADVSYFVAPGFIVRGGYLVLPFGSYTKRLAAGWINKLTSDPMGVGMAGSDYGVEVEGGFPLGNMKWSYDVALSNGFQLNNDGTISGVGISAINNGKTVSGRVALLPFSNSSLEFGVSGLYGNLAPTQGTNFANIDSTNTKGAMVSMYAVDVNFVQNVKPIQINIKGQYSASMVNNMNYLDTGAHTFYTFTNATSAYFGQISVRPSTSKNKILKNLELAFRYVNYTAPKQSTWGQNYSEVDIALDYWFSWRTVLKVGYESIKSDGTTLNSSPSGLDGSSTGINRLIIQFSTQL
jgi:hypothetical protein